MSARKPNAALRQATDQAFRDALGRGDTAKQALLYALLVAESFVGQP